MAEELDESGNGGGVVFWFDAEVAAGFDEGFGFLDFDVHVVDFSVF